jgi:hypothetical protein
LFSFGYLINFPFTFFKTVYSTIPPNINQIVVEGDLSEEKIKLFGRTNHVIGIDYLAFANGFPWSDAVSHSSVSIEGNRMIYQIQIDKKGLFREYRGRVKLFLPEKIAVDLTRMKGAIVEDNREK